MNSELPSAPPSHVYSTSEKLRSLAPCLRQRLRPRRNLIAGPYAGEFGWELMQWQAFVRGRRPHYEQVHVLTYPGRDYLYEGCIVHSHGIDLRTAGYGYGLTTPGEAQVMAREKASELGLEDYDVFDPSLLCTRYHKAIWKQEFRLFQEPPVSPSPYDVAFHFRAIKKAGPDHSKNYSPALADELANLCAARGLSVACIGHPDYSYCPTGFADHRSIELRQTVAAISSARTVAGENSGPMHLANLCGKPTIIWAENQWRVEYSLRWNPFRVPIYIASNTTCQPTPNQVCDTIVSALDDLAQRSKNFQNPLYTLPAGPIAPY